MAETRRKCRHERVSEAMRHCHELQGRGQTRRAVGEDLAEEALVALVGPAP